jgi:hypothetical protein
MISMMILINEVHPRPNQARPTQGKAESMFPRVMAS